MADFPGRVGSLLADTHNYTPPSYLAFWTDWQHTSVFSSRIHNSSATVQIHTVHHCWLTHSRQDIARLLIM